MIKFNDKTLQVYIYIYVHVYNHVVPNYYTQDYSEQLRFSFNEIYQPQLHMLRLNKV